jgi:putative tricarboxylic transport membrane protein
MRNYDLVSSIAWFAIGLGCILEGLKLGFGRWDAPGPGFLPAVIGACLAALSVGLFLKTLFSRVPEGGAKRFWKSQGGWKKVFSVLGALICYVVVLFPLGYVITTTLFLTFLIKFIGKKKWWFSVMISIVASLISFLAFRNWMGVPLPLGLLTIIH